MIVPCTKFHVSTYMYRNVSFSFVSEPPANRISARRPTTLTDIFRSFPQSLNPHLPIQFLLRSVSILFFHLRLGRPGGLFLSCLPIKILCKFISCMRATRAAHPRPLHVHKSEPLDHILWHITQSAPPYSISVRSVLILSFHLRLCLQGGLSPLDFPIKILYKLILRMRATRPAYLTSFI
jgi:hypothetical protein